MHFLHQLTLHFFTTLLLCSCASRVRYANKDQIAQTILVDPSGKGNFLTVQQAIDSVPPNNNQWRLIHLGAAIYNEKVNIPKEKPMIVLEGEGPNGATVIQWGDGGDSFKSSTFTLSAENFVARQITFKNTNKQKPFTWAPAALINADKASFHSCSFISLQDTLTDLQGRHYFDSCYIQGAVDFIWGSATSIYQGCTINVTTSLIGAGPAYITAQGRSRSDDKSGFAFTNSFVVGTGPAYLGRAYGKYSRVVFYNTDMANIIVPQGWSAWSFTGQESTIAYAESNCTGLGADKSKRVPWEQSLSDDVLLRSLTNVATFIDQDGWLEKQLPSSN